MFPVIDAGAFLALLVAFASFDFVRLLLFHLRRIEFAHGESLMGQDLADLLALAESFAEEVGIRICGWLEIDMK